MRLLSHFSFALGLACLLTGCMDRPENKVSAAGPAKTSAAKDTKKVAHPFTLKDVNGKMVSLSDYKGKVVLLNFWATWCGPCKVEIPWFVEFEQKYKDRGFAVLGVSMDEEGWEVVKPYLATNKINYRVMVGDDKLAEVYEGVESLPTTFIVDQGGFISAKHEGLVSKGTYEDEIRRLLDKRAHADFGVFALLARPNQP